MLPFSEVGQITQLYHTEWSWSPLFADYDNDGDKDLLVSNGYPKDMTNRDWTKIMSSNQNNPNVEKNILSVLPDVNVPNVAFINFGNLNFQKTLTWLPNVPSFSYGAAFGDLDNDGDLDYITNNFNKQAFIYKNNLREHSTDGGNFLRIKLEGSKENKMALGTKVSLWQNGSYQFAEYYLSRGYASTVEPFIHFGLPFNGPIDSIIITWPTQGKITRIENVEPNQILTLSESDAANILYKPNSSTNSQFFFTEVDSIIDYTHKQTDFIDFFLGQKIIPHKFSQIGPKMAKGDFNGDGLEDIITGSTNNMPTKVFLRTNNRYEETSIEGLTTHKEFSEAGFAVGDWDNDGDNDVVAIAGGLETRKESQTHDYTSIGNQYDMIEKENDLCHYLYLNNGTRFIKQSLPIPPFIASVILPFDYDRDGFTDLFIGARLYKGRFPFAPVSWIIHNEKGKFEINPYSKFDLGMVTNATLTDYNQDGWMDILVSREFNSLILLENKEGMRFEPIVIKDLEQHHGLWYAVAAGDFDQDGDDDYIVGNLGDNNQFKVSIKYPMNLYAMDVDNNGIIEPVRTAYWKNEVGKMKEYPVNCLDELIEQSIFFKNKFDNYSSFSYADFDDIFDRNAKRSIRLKLYVNTTSSYLLWNDNGKFRWEKLPRELQVAPITNFLVEDFNDDNYPDILLGGNDYSWEVATGVYDANKGFLLLNMGEKRKADSFPFEILTPAQSGILLDGMLQSLLYLEGESKLILAGFNRNKAKTYRLNQH